MEGGLAFAWLAVVSAGIRDFLAGVSDVLPDRIQQYVLLPGFSGKRLFLDSGWGLVPASKLGAFRSIRS